MKRLFLLLLLCCGSAYATVPLVPYTVTYACAGGFGPFPFSFPISDPTSLTVTLNGVLLGSTSYTVVPVNNNYNNGGNVTLGGSFPCTSGLSLVLTRVTPITQLTQFYDNMPSLPMITGRSVDKLTEIAQEIQGLIGQIVAGGLRITGSSPIVVTPSPITGIGVISCPTCSTGGSGTVTTVSSGNLTPLFTVNVANPTTTPAFTFTLSNFAADSIFGNFTGGSAAPSTQAIPSCAADGTHAITYPSHTLTCTSITGTGGLPTGTGVVRVDSSTGSAAELNGDVTSTAGNATTVVKVNGAAVPASATVLASNSSHQIITATFQGNGAKAQLSTGSTTTNDCVKFDANGNTVDAGSACGAGGGGTYPNYGTDTGSVNAYAVSPSGCSAGLTTGKVAVSFIAANASTSSTPTLAYCGGSALTITTVGTNALLSGCINTSRIHTYNYDGMGWQEDACDVGRGSVPVTDISPTSGDTILVQDLPTNATITRIICGVAAVTSAVVDFKPASESAWGTLGSSILSGTITAVPGGATGTITTPALSTHTPLMMVVGTVTGTVGELYCQIEYQRSF